MATARIDVSTLPPFDHVSDPTSVGQHWTQWKHRFETYLVTANVKDDAQQRALLLYQAGATTQDIFESLPVAYLNHYLMKRKTTRPVKQVHPLTQVVFPTHGKLLELIRFSRKEIRLRSLTIDQYQSCLSSQGSMKN